MTNCEVTAQIDAAGVANAATEQEYRANWRCVNESKVLVVGQFESHRRGGVQVMKRFRSVARYDTGGPEVKIDRIASLA
jgi:hypothetical protein